MNKTLNIAIIVVLLVALLTAGVGGLLLAGGTLAIGAGKAATSGRKSIGSSSPELKRLRRGF